MTPRRPVLLAALVCLGPLIAAADDDDLKPAAPGSASAPGAALRSEQATAVGVEVARAHPARSAARTVAFGRVLDPTQLQLDLEALAAASAAEHASALELERLRKLFEAGAEASARSVESATADHGKALTERVAAESRLAVRWGALATLAPSARAALASRLLRGASALVRADLPGRHSVGPPPLRALVSIDGLELPAQIHGALRELDELQSAGWLLEVTHPPPGLAAGAQVPVTLIEAVRSGYALPPGAILYDEHGAYVYKRAAAGGGERYVPVRVELLAPDGAGWLVEGIGADDDIVMSGAGVLWSLQGVGGRRDDTDED